VPADAGAWIPARLERLDELLRAHDYKGWDPFDLPNAPVFSVVPDGWWMPQLVLSKAGSRVAPDGLRRALRVPEIEDPKIYACSYFGYRHWDAPDSAAHAAEMIERLAGAATREPDGSAYWGYDYTWATRTGEVNPRGASTIVPGSFAVFALLDDLVATGDRRHQDLVASALDYYRTHHWRAAPDGDFIAYFKGASVNTHNANLLACAALTLGGRVLDREDWMADAARAAATSVRAVREDGHLPYADHVAGDWTDCFHHLYVIACASVVERLNPLAEREEFADAIERLRRYLRESFLRDDGLVDYYPGRLHPIDPHNYAAAALFALMFGDHTDLPAARAEPLLRSVDELMWDERRGRYRYRRHRRRTDSRLFVRWTQAWMFAALAFVHQDATRSRRMSESTRNFVAQFGN
jgi:polysaccharide biosynthesis protein VpsJ